MSTRVAQVIWDLAMEKADRIAAGKAKPGRPSDPDLVPRDVVLREFAARWFGARVSAAIKKKLWRGLFRMEQAGVLVRESRHVRILDWDSLEAIANEELVTWEEPRGVVTLRPSRGVGEVEQ